MENGGGVDLGERGGGSGMGTRRSWGRTNCSQDALKTHKQTKYYQNILKRMANPFQSIRSLKGLSQESKKKKKSNVKMKKMDNI